jgi:hypothetical protein
MGTLVDAEPHALCRLLVMPPVDPHLYVAVFLEHFLKLLDRSAEAELVLREQMSRLCVGI